MTRKNYSKCANMMVLAGIYVNKAFIMVFYSHFMYSVEISNSII